MIEEEKNNYVISNRIYFKADNDLIKKLMEELTYKVSVIRDTKGRYDKTEIIRNYKVPSKGVISIPQGRTDLVPKGLNLVDKRTLVPVDFPEPLLPLRQDQQEVYDKVEDTCFINALVGWGTQKSCPQYR